MEISNNNNVIMSCVVAWGDLAWMVGVVAALPLGLYGPQAFSVGGGPLTVNARLAWNCSSQSCQQSGGPGQPALHAPGLPANNYSGNQASGLRKLVFGKGIDA